MQAIDHDDGSQRFNDTENVMVFGGCKNFLGNSKSCDHNLIVFPGAAEHSSGARRCQTDDNHVFVTTVESTTFPYRRKHKYALMLFENQKRYIL